MALLLSSSCAVPIKNERWYGDVGPKGAIWFETLSELSGSVSKEDWDQMRIGMACTTTDVVGEIKAEIEKLCSKTQCDYEKVEEALGKFARDLDSMKAAIQ